MRKFFLFIIILSLLLTGCVEEETIDDVNLVTVMAFDRTEENKLRGTAVINTYLKDQPVKDFLIGEKSELSREVISNLQRKTPEPLVVGKLQVVLFGKKLADVGINEIVDTLQRDAAISDRLLLVVTRGEAKNILEADFGTEGASRFISSLILHNKLNRDLPMTNLHVFLYQYYSRGHDPYLPILKESDKKIEIDGLALFDNHKLVGEISTGKLLFFKVLADQYSKGVYTLELPESQKKVGINSIYSSRKFKLISTNPLKVEINVHIEGYINEYTGKKITQEIINEVEVAFSKKVENESEALIEKFRELKIDPLGIGDDIRSKSREFDIDKWREKIPELEVDVKADVLISETGVID